MKMSRGDRHRVLNPLDIHVLGALPLLAQVWVWRKVDWRGEARLGFWCALVLSQSVFCGFGLTSCFVF